jgi:hypothetical protein
MSRCIDLFSGTRSATKYFDKAGWEMRYVEITEGVDVRTYHPPKADFVWASPPCTEYSYSNRKFATWESKYQTAPMLWRSAMRVIREARPRFWVIENVKGAQQIWGKAPYNYGSFFLWGYFPFDLLPVIPWTTSLKGTHADRSVVTDKNGGLYQWDEGRSAAEKAMIPDALARAVFKVCQANLDLPDGGPEPEALSLEQFQPMNDLRMEAVPKCSFCGKPMNWIDWPITLGGNRAFYCDNGECELWMDFIEAQP